MRRIYLQPLPSALLILTWCALCAYPSCNAAAAADAVRPQFSEKQHTRRTSVRRRRPRFVVRQQHEWIRHAADIYLKRGVEHGERGEHAQALEARTLAARLDPDSAYARYNMAWAFVQLDRHREAIEPALEAVELDAEFPEAYFILGVAYAALGDDERAISAYKRAIHLKPNYADALNNLANVFYH